MNAFAPAARRTALLALAVPLLGGCGFFAGMAQGPTDSLATWSAQPLPPDAAMTAAAIGERGVCLMADPDDVAPAIRPQVLVQDRRMQNTAAFLVQNAEHFGSCMVSRSSGGSGGWGPPLEPPTGPLTVDDSASPTAGDGAAKQLGGRISLPGARVVVRLDDGREVLASIGNGFWLAWWPAINRAVEVVAIDGVGNELASVVPPQ